MADVQLQNGHVRIANALCEALYRLRIPGRHKDVIACVIRYTFGFNRSEDTFASSQIADATGIDARNVRRILSDLVEWGLIGRRDNGRNRAPTLSIVKDYDVWNVSSTNNAKSIQGQKVGSSTTRPKKAVGSFTSREVGSSTTRKVGSCAPPSKDIKTERQDGAVAPDPPPLKSDPYQRPKNARTLSEKTIATMISVKPNGVEYEPEDVRIWFYAKVPIMQLRGVKNCVLAAKKWWPNVKPGEVKEARQWLRDVNSRARAEEIKAEMVAQPDPSTEFTQEQIEDASLALQ